MEENLLKKIFLNPCQQILATKTSKSDKSTIHNNRTKK